MFLLACWATSGWSDHHKWVDLPATWLLMKPLQKCKLNALSCGYISDFLLAMVIQFFENITLPAHGENCICSHLHTGEVTSLCFAAKNSTDSPVRGWLNVRFLPHAGNTRIKKKCINLSLKIPQDPNRILIGSYRILP